jgi:hypothetical protein
MTVRRRFTVTGFNRSPDSAFHFSICHVVISAKGVSPNNAANSLYFSASFENGPAFSLSPS